MSFSWSITDKDGKSLLDAYIINGQAIGLGDDNSVSLDTLRNEFCRVYLPAAKKMEEISRAKVARIQHLVQQNLDYYKQPPHDCPNCKCERPVDKKAFFVFDIEQAERFVSIPPERVWRAWGGW